MAGARDIGSLHHIISRLEYDPEIKLHFIAVEHPFKQANKRTAFFTADTIPGSAGLFIKVEADEGEKFILEVARDEHTFKEVEIWIRKHIGGLSPA